MKSQIWTLILQSFQNNNFVDIAFRTVSGKSARNTWFKTQKHINSGKTRENQKRRILNIAITTNTKNVNKYRTYYLKRIVGFYRRSTVWCNGWTFFQNPDTKFDEEESLYIHRCGFYQWTPRNKRRKRALPYHCDENMASSINLSTHQNQNIVQEVGDITDLYLWKIKNDIAC